MDREIAPHKLGQFKNQILTKFGKNGYFFLKYTPKMSKFIAKNPSAVTSVVVTKSKSVHKFRQRITKLFSAAHKIVGTP